MLLAGLPAGALADRYDSRTIVIITETARAAVTAAVAVALAAGWVPLPLLFAAAALLGAGQAIRNPASMLLTRSVVPPEQLTRALTQDEVRVNGAALAGPALGGALYACARSGTRCRSGHRGLVRDRGRHHDADEGSGRAAGGRRPREPCLQERACRRPGSMLAGVRVLWQQPVLRAATVLIMLVNTTGAGLELVVVVILRHQAVRPALIGLALGAGAAGGLAGAPLVRILHRVRPGLLLLAVCTLDGVILGLLRCRPGPGGWPACCSPPCSAYRPSACSSTSW